MSEIEAIVLAGGRGSRMNHLTEEKQKCLLPVEEKPILGGIMDSLVDAFGSVDLKIGIGYKGNDVIEYVNKNHPKNVNVTFVPHSPGTEGWGIYRDMRDYVHGDFVAMPGDILAYPEVYRDALTSFKDSQVEASMTLSPNILEAQSHGVGKSEGSLMVDLIWPTPDLVNVDKEYGRDMTIWASDVNFFDVIEKYKHDKRSIGYVFADAIKNGHTIAGNIYRGPWIHLELPSDLERILA